MANKKKLNSKVPTIKKLIALDPFHPGSLTPQQYKKKGGKKSKKYYTWQSSFQGKKKSVRIPDDQVDEIQKLIDAAKKKAQNSTKRDATELKAYNRALDELMRKNANIRKQNGDNAIGSKKEDK